MKIVWTGSARLDLREIFEFIVEDNPNAARTLLAEIRKRASSLEDNPQIGRLGRLEGARELVLAGIHYILPYRVKEREIQILAVFHTARQWPKSL